MDLPAPTEIAGLLAQGPSVTTADFLARFGQLYDAVWPAQLLAIAGAVGVYELTRRQRHDRTGLLLIVLALAWAWTGWSYHGHHFAEVTPLSGLYMLGFLVQSVLLLLAALANPS
jgi:hypothetical protein